MYDIIIYILKAENMMRNNSLIIHIIMIGLD